MLIDLLLFYVIDDIMLWFMYVVGFLNVYKMINYIKYMIILVFIDIYIKVDFIYCIY